MKKTITISAFLLVAIVFTACSGGTATEESKDTAAASVPSADTSSGNMMASVKYTCTMHPEVISDTMGKCPKCEMDLVPMKDSMMNMSKDSMMK